MSELTIQGAAQAGVNQAIDVIDKMADTALSSVLGGSQIGVSSVRAVVEIAGFTAQNAVDVVQGTSDVLLREVEEETAQLEAAIQKWRESVKGKLQQTLSNAVEVLPGE